MILTLDGERRALPDRTDSLAALLDASRSVLPDDHIIVSVRVNGEELVNDALATQLTTAVAADAQIDLESAPRGSVVAEALRGLLDRLAALEDYAPEFATKLRTRAASVCSGELNPFLECWQDVTRTLSDGGALLQRDLTALSGESLAEALAALSATLRDLRSAVDARDVVFIADILEYEQPAQLAQWRSALARIADQVERPD